MIRHIIKLIWNKKGNNSLLLLEIFLSFLVLSAVISYVLYNTDRLGLPTGFETENRWMVFLDDRNSDLDSLGKVQMKENLRTSLQEMQNVELVAMGNSVTPFSQNTWQSSDDDLGFEIFTRYVRADEKFAKTMGMNVIEGRWFNEEDANAAYKPMIVNKYFADKYFPEISLVDSIIPFSGDKKIVGVIDDYRYDGIFEEEQETSFFYQPHTHEQSSVVYLKMAPNTPNSYEEKVSKMVESITKSSSFVIQDLQTLADRRERETWVPMIALLAISGFLCLNVALGLFGVLWYTINKRRSEIGLRRALGAHTSNIAQQFTLEILILTGLGILVGVFFAIQVPLLKLVPIENMIFYRAILFSALIILIIVTICALYPSRQASKIHPATALHED